jgi:hypothetical protein
MECKVRILPRFAAGFEAFPLRVGVLDLVRSSRWGAARRIGGALAANGSRLRPKLAPQSPPLKDAPACATNESSTGAAFQIGEGDLPK